MSAYNNNGNDDGNQDDPQSMRTIANDSSNHQHAAIINNTMSEVGDETNDSNRLLNANTDSEYGTSSRTNNPPPRNESSVYAETEAPSARGQVDYTDDDGAAPRRGSANAATPDAEEIDATTRQSSNNNARAHTGAEPQPQPSLTLMPSMSAYDNISLADNRSVFTGASSARGHGSTLDGDGRGEGSHTVDFLHKVFFYLTIPGTIAVVIVAAVLYTMKDIEPHTAALGVASACAFSATCLTVFLIYLHLTVYTNPVQQRLIVRILIMVPIYAIDSLLALIFFKYAPLVNLLRDTYEAYVIYMFFKLLMSYLGSERLVLQQWAAEKPTMAHLFPLCLLPHLKLNATTLAVWKVCLVQYMILNPLLTLIAVPFSFLPTDSPAYKDGDFSPKNLYIYTAGIRFVSVTFAFTSLVYFFFATKTFMMEHKPLAKFAAIKAIVFLSFWQTVLLAGLAHFNIIRGKHLWSKDEVSMALGNFVICVEMYLISVLHRWIFADTPYMPTDRYRSRWPSFFALKHAFSVRDVFDDTTAAAGLAKGLVTSPKFFGGNGFHHPDEEDGENNGNDGSGTARRRAASPPDEDNQSETQSMCSAQVEHANHGTFEPPAVGSA